MLLSLFLQRPCIKWKVLIKSVRDNFSLSCACRNQTEFVTFVFRSLKYLWIELGLKVQQRRSKGGPSTGPTCALAPWESSNGKSDWLHVMFCKIPGFHIDENNKDQNAVKVISADLYWDVWNLSFKFSIQHLCMMV